MTGWLHGEVRLKKLENCELFLCNTFLEWEKVLNCFHYSDMFLFMWSLLSRYQSRVWFECPFTLVFLSDKICASKMLCVFRRERVNWVSRVRIFLNVTFLNYFKVMISYIFYIIRMLLAITSFDHLILDTIKVSPEHSNVLFIVYMVSFQWTLWMTYLHNK